MGYIHVFSVADLDKIRTTQYVRLTNVIIERNGLVDCFMRRLNIVLRIAFATVIGVGAELPDISAVVAWVPDPNIGDLHRPESGYMEECGQRVRAACWQEAHDATIAHKLRAVTAPTYIVQGTKDEYVDQSNRDAITHNAQPHHQVENLEGLSHSSWTNDQAESIIQQSIEFIHRALSR